MSLPFRIPALFLALSLSFNPFLHAQVPVEPAHVAELAAFIGPFPTAASEEGKADLAIVLWHQRTRTQPEIQRAQAEVKLVLGAYAAAAGVSLDPAQYPKTAALIEKVGKDIKAQTDGLKKHFLRPRPYQADARVQPAIDRESSPSYPSGHATRGLVFAIVLADLVPERREPLLTQGRQVGVNRVIGGVHYPTDIEAGQRLALKLAAVWLADAQNRSLVESVRAVEWTAQPKH